MVARMHATMHGTLGLGFRRIWERSQTTLQGTLKAQIVESSAHSVQIPGHTRRHCGLAQNQTLNEGRYSALFLTHLCVLGYVPELWAFRSFGPGPACSGYLCCLGFVARYDWLQGAHIEFFKS